MQLGPSTRTAAAHPPTHSMEGMARPRSKVREWQLRLYAVTVQLNSISSNMGLAEPVHQMQHHPPTWVLHSSRLPGAASSPQLYPTMMRLQPRHDTTRSSMPAAKRPRTVSDLGVGVKGSERGAGEEAAVEDGESAHSHDSTASRRTPQDHAAPPAHTCQ